MIERFHRSLKTALKARLTGLNWVEELPWVLLGLRNAPKEEFGYSSAELVYGESLTVPGEFIPPWFTNDPAQESPLKFRGNIPTNFPRPASSHSSTATFVPPSLMTAKYVYVRRDGTKGLLQRPYTGPYAVLTPGDKTFLLDIGGRTERISVDRLKPAFYDPALPVQVVKPPPRGRPPQWSRDDLQVAALYKDLLHRHQVKPLLGLVVTREVPLYRRHAQAVQFGVLYVISDFLPCQSLGGGGGGELCGVDNRQDWLLHTTGHDVRCDVIDMCLFWCCKL